MIADSPFKVSSHQIAIEWLLRPLNFADIMGRQSQIQCALGRMEQVTGAYPFLSETEQRRCDAWCVTADAVMAELRGTVHDG